LNFSDSGWSLYIQEDMGLLLSLLAYCVTRTLKKSA